MPCVSNLVFIHIHLYRYVCKFYTVLVYAGIIIFMPSEFKRPGRYALSSKFNGRHKSLANFFNLQRSYKKTPTLYFINCLRSYRHGSFSTAQVKSQCVSYPPKLTLFSMFRVAYRHFDTSYTCNAHP